MTPLLASIPLLVLITYLSKVPVAVAMAKLGGYDNHMPRDQQARLSGWGRRALAAHQNSFEIFPIYAACALVGHLTTATPERATPLAAVFLVSRVLYVACYLADWSNLRSFVWFVGLGSAMSIALLSIAV